jgi:MYXO-CTERM domain-containing protein
VRHRSSAGLAALLLLLPTRVAAGPLHDLPPGSWYEVPNSHLRDVAHDWSPDPTPGNVGGIIKAWGGGAFDTNGERLLLLGGGHGDYGGNEIYAMDLDTVENGPSTNPWEKLSDPEAFDALDPDCSNPDNLTDNDQRRSQHSYSRLAYIPELDALCDTGGSIGYTYCPALRQLDCFDLSTRTWTLGLTAADAAGTGSTGAVHPDTGQWWLQGGSGSGLLGRFDPQSLSWTYGHYDNIPGSSPGSTSAAIDPTRNLFVLVGNQRLWALDLGTFEEGVTELSEHPAPSTGGDAVIAASAPGFAYDPVQDRMVAWVGGADVYLLDLDSWTWTRSTPVGATPTAAVGNGTFGRFRYSPKYNVFVVVSSADENAFAVKLSPTPLACSEGQTRSCYEGPASTGSVGACQDGTQACAQGQWGECDGQVMPSAEACNAVDDDCDGVVDEGCGVDAGADGEVGPDAWDGEVESDGQAEGGAEPAPEAGAKVVSSDESDGGCGCRSSGGGTGWGASLGVLLSALFLARRRRGSR